MPCSITTRSVSYQTPDGKPILSDIDLVFGPQPTALIGRNGTGKSTLLRLIAGELACSRGEIVTTGTVAMLRQSVQRADGTVAEALGCADALARLHRLDSGNGLAEDASQVDWALPSRIDAALDRMGLPPLALDRSLATLSGGQRTRLGLAALVIANPDFLLLDEPTNDLDALGRETVISLVRDWRGGVIVVSHDRTLLREVDLIVELTSLGARRYGGNWDAYRTQKAAELSAAEHAYSTAERSVRVIDLKTQQTKERKSRKDGAGKRKARRGDLPRILLGARKETSEATSGEQARLSESRRAAALAKLAEARAEIEVLAPFAVRLESCGSASGTVVLQFDCVTGGPQPNNPIVRDLSFTVLGHDRVAVVGPNGSGKTSLLRLAAGSLTPIAGMIRSHGTVAVLDQEIRLLDPSQSIRENFLRLNPGEDENCCRAALARFAFRAETSLKPVGALSGGEMLRAGLACTIGSTKPPQLLILDEPTNHIDLEAITAIESGLCAYDGALLVASHDEEFLKAIGISRSLLLRERTYEIKSGSSA